MRTRGISFIYFPELNNVKTSNIKRNYKFISENKIEAPKVLNGSNQLIKYKTLLFSNSIKNILKQK